MSELKLCKDCKHYRPGAYAYGLSCEAACLHPENMETCPVSGGRAFKDGGYATTPLYQRKQGGCGMDAKRFEQAPPPEPPKAIEYEPKGIMRRTEGRPYTLWDRIFG